MRISCAAKDSYIFPTKKVIIIYYIFMFEILTKRLTYDVVTVNFEQPAPDCQILSQFKI